MASDKLAVASGADHTQTARRRNVPSSNGSLVDTVEIDDKKTQVKKVSKSHELPLLWFPRMLNWQIIPKRSKTP